MSVRNADIMFHIATANPSHSFEDKGGFKITSKTYWMALHGKLIAGRDFFYAVAFPLNVQRVECRMQGGGRREAIRFDQYNVVRRLRAKWNDSPETSARISPISKAYRWHNSATRNMRFDTLAALTKAQPLRAFWRNFRWTEDMSHNMKTKTATKRVACWG